MDRRQQEAFLNEYKGNLFEFLVGKYLAQQIGQFTTFYAAIPSDYLAQLQHYETALYSLDRQLLEKLPVLALKCGEFVLAHYTHLSAINLIGKDTTIKQKAEGDLRIVNAGVEHLLSLKLAKAGSQVNTKSGGIKSFIRRYFGPFPTAVKQQQEMNILVEQGFSSMLHALYAEVGLEFNGHYDEQWKEIGLSELPGQLPKNLQQIVYQYYYRLTQKLYTTLFAFYQEDLPLFRHCFAQLIGLSLSSVDQVCLYHQDHQLKNLTFLSAEDLAWRQDIEFFPQYALKSYFELKWAAYTIQIRLKPMNRFTQASLKVNCTIGIKA